MDKRVKLKVQELTNSKIKSDAYALILAEENGYRRLPIVIGIAEAQSIAISIEGITPPRPLTHDLFITFALSFGIVLKEVFIYKFLDGVYYSELKFSDGEKIVKIDSRTSDAIAIAIRMGCDIYTKSEILDECAITPDDFDLDDLNDNIPNNYAGKLVSYYEDFFPDNDYIDDNDEDLLLLEPEDIDDEEELKKWLSLVPLKELNERLEDSISKENYEYAKMYKDELTRREKKEE